MAKVTRIGGVFLRAQEPKALAEWYATRMGITAGDTGWAQATVPTGFAPFPADTDDFLADRQYMLNLRVDDLPAAPFAAAGIATETRPG